MATQVRLQYRKVNIRFDNGYKIRLGDVYQVTPEGESVTSDNNITDNALTKGNGGAKKIQETGIIVDDSNNVSNAKINADNNTITNIDNDEVKEAAGIESSKIAASAEALSDATTLSGLFADLNNSLPREENTGFYSWSGAGNYYQITGSTEFDLLRGGTGYILGKEVTWDAQTGAVLPANQTQYVYIDNTGTIGYSNTRTNELFINNIVLFEVLNDGTNIDVVKENHPYCFDACISNEFHDVIGSVIENSGANITRVSTGTGGAAGDREVKIVGAAELHDHGLSTDIPDSGGSAITLQQYYTNGSGKWNRNANQTQLTMEYNNAGTPTALGAGKYGVYRIYVSKNDLNTTTPLYFAVMHTEEFNNLALARVAINTGVAQPTNELAALEMAQLGYAIVLNSGGGYIAELQIAKETLRSQITGGAASNLAANIIVDATGFTGNLSTGDTTVQTALETIDGLALTYDTDTDLSGNGWFLDEDDMSSNDPTKAASQQSIKAYVDNQTVTQSVRYETKTYTLQGEIKVPSGDTDVIPPFEINEDTNDAITLEKWSGAIGSGTSVTIKLQKSNGSGGAFADVTGFTGFVVSGGFTNPSSSDPSNVALADGEVLQPVVTAVSGTPTNLMLNIVLKHTVTLT
jgi:hypothetical protein